MPASIFITRVNHPTASHDTERPAFIPAPATLDAHRPYRASPSSVALKCQNDFFIPMLSAFAVTTSAYTFTRFEKEPVKVRSPVLVCAFSPPAAVGAPVSPLQLQHILCPIRVVA